MTQEEKIKLLEELFEEDEGTLSPELKLDQIAWDSMAMLGLIALVNEHFGKRFYERSIRNLRSGQGLCVILRCAGQSRWQ